MQTVHIPTPCHENWNEMTPTQKGAFCGKCAIDVVDFSKMQNDEVKEFLETNKGKHLCGRFGNDQLDDINAELKWIENNSWQGYLSKFVCALIFAFGLSLFNGVQAQSDRQMRNMIQGMVAYVEPIPVDTTKNIASLDTTTVEPELEENSCEKDYRKGKIAYNPPKEQTKKPLKDTTIVEEEVEIFTLGEIVVLEPVIEDTTKGEIKVVEDDDDQNNDLPQNDSLAKPKEVIKSRYQLKDKNPAPEKKPLKTTPVLITGPKPIANPDYEVNVYPNPTASQSEIVITNDSEQQFDVYLFSSNGTLINTVFSGVLNTGQQRFIIDLSSLSTGIYYVQFMTIKGSETHKIRKVE